MILVVAGWRAHPDEHVVYDELDRLYRDTTWHRGFQVIVGDCPTGVDDYTRTWCQMRGVSYRVFKARDYGMWPWCGPRRNKAMIAHLVRVPTFGRKAVLAFPQPDWETARVCGTRSTIRSAQKAGFTPKIVPALIPEEAGRA